MNHEQPFPTVEFGFEYFFAMVVSKVYRVRFMALIIIRAEKWFHRANCHNFKQIRDSFPL